MFKTFITLIVCFGLSFSLCAQKENSHTLVDTLLTELSETNEDTVKIDILLKLAKKTIGKNIKHSIEYGEKALALAKKINYKAGIAASTNGLGLTYTQKGDFPKALSYLQQSLSTAEEGNDIEMIVTVYINLITIYNGQGKFDKSMDYARKGLSICNEIDYKTGVASLNDAIAIIHYYKSDFAKALEFMKLALIDYEEINDAEKIASALMNIGSVHAMQGDNDKALEYYRKYLKLNENDKNTRGYAMCLVNIGDIYQYKKKYSESIGYLNKGLAIQEKIGAVNDMKMTYKDMFETYKLSGNYKASLAAHEQYVILKDSVYNKKNTEKIARLEVTAEYEKIQYADSLQNANVQKIAAQKLQKQRVFTYSGIGVALLLMGLSFFIAKERKKSDKLLLNILPAAVAKELKQEGMSEAKLFQDTTVLFTDFVGFTRVSEQLTPKELVAELDACFKAFDGIMDKHDIEKIKTVGDAYLAVCGLPTADKQHAVKVVKAAQDIRAFMLNRHAQLGNKTFEIRIGIHSGDVVAGIVGIKKYAYDIWSDTVNTAARMEQSCEVGKINISHTTYELVHDKFSCDYRGELEAKNKGKLKMYFVET